MAAIGCLHPFVLLAGGAVVVGMIGGTTTGLWGGAAGFVIGLICLLLAVRAFDRAQDILQ
jgi:hypothetical protein